MKIKKMPMLVTNADMKKTKENVDYCSIGLLSMDDGQKFDVSCREPELYGKLKPLNTATLDMDLTNSKYGMKLTITNVISTDKGLAEAK